MTWMAISTVCCSTIVFASLWLDFRYLVRVQERLFGSQEIQLCAIAISSPNDPLISQVDSLSKTNGTFNFKRKMTDISKWIDNEVKTNDVVLFMKGTPDMPMCGFSGKATQILNHMGVPFKGINVLDSDEVRQGIKEYANWPTIPQLWVKGEFVGGSDIMMEMFQSGELKQLLTEKAIA